MPFQLPDPKVPVFPGINDEPITPTAQAAGNGAHLIQQHNLLVDLFNFSNNNQPEPISYRSLIETLTLTQGTEWYVDPVNGSDDNDGLSVGTAFLTLEKASAIAAGYLNPFRHRRIINLLPGSYDKTYLSGHTSDNWREGIEILGSYESPETVVINGTLHHRYGGYYRINGVTFASSNISLDINNSILEIGKIQFIGEASVHINVANHAKVEAVATYSIMGNATDSHIKIDTFSCFDFISTEFEYGGINIADNVSLNNFVHLVRNSYLSTKLTVFNGSVVGRKFLVDNNSTIDTDGKDMDFFPGDTPGILTKNSNYF